MASRRGPRPRIVIMKSEACTVADRRRKALGRKTYVRYGMCVEHNSVLDADWRRSQP
jgi:hypothetical protein